MEDEKFLRVSSRVRIPLDEIEIVYTRSSGPGGQHVNKTSTQAELSFDLAHSPSFSADDHEWVMEKLASRLDSEGKLRITSQNYRSQLRNKNAALEKLASTLGTALVRPNARKKTRPSKGARENRLESKRKAGEKKRMRGNPFSD